MGELPEALEPVRSFLVGRLGGRLDGPLGDSLPERAWRIVRASGVDVSALAQAGCVAPESGLYRACVDELTVGETYFFRDLESLELVVRRALAARDVTRLVEPLRIWSAGCSTGEEVHTLAYLARRSSAASGSAASGAVMVLGTDVATSRLQIARARRYSRRCLRGRGCPPDFADLEDDSLTVRSLAGTRVDFREHNLLTESPPGAGFDIVVCRNVLIYLDDTWRARALESFLRALRPGGWLLLGTSDLVGASHLLPARLVRDADAPWLLRFEAEAEAPPLPPDLAPRGLPRPVEDAAVVRPAVAAPTTPSLTPRDRAHLLVATAARQLAAGDERGAEATCLEALDLAPDQLEAVLLLAHLAERREESSTARLLLSAARAAHPLEPRVERAWRELERGADHA